MTPDLLNTAGELSYWALKLYEWIIILAILVSWVNPDPSNTLVRFLNRMTEPFWNWVGARLPGPLRLFPAYVSLMLVWFGQIFLPGSFSTFALYVGDRITAASVPERLLGFFLLATGRVTWQLLFFIIILLLVWFFLTLINPSLNNPIVRTVYYLVDPFITPVQKRLPRQRFDFSPVIVAGVLFAVNILVVDSIIRFALGMATGGIPNLPMQTM